MHRSKMATFIVAFIFTFASVTVFAEDNWCGEISGFGACTHVTIKGIYVRAGAGNTLIATSGTENATGDSCGVYLQLNQADDGYEALFSLFLSAYLSGQEFKTIRLKPEAGKECEIAYALLGEY